MLRMLLRSLSGVVGTGRGHQLINHTPLTGLDLAEIRLALSNSSIRTCSQPCKFSSRENRHAAVLVALCNMAGEGPGVLFTVRSQTMRTHPGEISLPGGHQDPEIDQSLLSTALRETYEEVGLFPGQLEYLGSLDPMISNSGITLVWPHVVFVHSVKNNARVHGPMIPRVMSKIGNEPLESPRLEDLQGKHQVAEVDVVLQIPITTLLNPKRQIHANFRNDPQNPYLEWLVEEEVNTARHMNKNNNLKMKQNQVIHTGSESLRLWGLSGWII